MPGDSPRVNLALVHHANQYVVTDGYENRDGMGEILGLNEPCDEAAYGRGLLPLLQLHLTHGVPINLHLSGTLIETLAWHYPDTFVLVRRLADAGLLEIVGSTFSQNVMPFFSDRCNRRQIEEALWLYREHLDWAPTLVKSFWVPERVWHTEKLAPLLRQRDLPNAGYRYVLLDDRIAYPVGAHYSGSERARFDLNREPTLESFLPWDIAGSDGLVMLPISIALRYLIPPSTLEAHHRMEGLFRWLAHAGDGRHIAVYGDDLERAAGVGGWNRHGPQYYEQWLRWLKANPWVTPVRISDWAAQVSPPAARVIEPGTFYELAQTWKAREDYRGWYDDPDCSLHRRYLLQSEQRLIEAEQHGADPGLLDLGWQHLLHVSYETSWHNVENGNAPGQLAPWAAALTSHARSCLVVALAAEWCATRDQQAHAEIMDVDGDGEDELVLKNDRLMAVISPRCGGRVTYLFEFTNGAGCLVVGNISDDWNLQEELNRYLERPRNHPGALADVGHENDVHEAVVGTTRRDGVVVTLCNRQPESPLNGTKKRISLAINARHMRVVYELPSHLKRLSTEFCFSPDYSRALRLGRRALRRIEGGNVRGWRNGVSCVWLRVDSHRSVIWDKPYQIECGHGLNMRVTAFEPVFHLDIGVGPPPRAAARVGVGH